MILRKINFDMIWYSVMFAAILYLSKFIWFLELRFYECCHSCILKTRFFLPMHRDFFFFNKDCIFIYIFLHFSFSLIKWISINYSSEANVYKKILNLTWFICWLAVEQHMIKLTCHAYCRALSWQRPFSECPNCVW